MTQIVEPSQSAESDPSATAQAHLRGTGDYIVAASDPEKYSQHDNRLATITTEFGVDASSSGLNLVIEPGEGYVGGHWFAKDTNTTVPLAASTADQIVKVGVDRSAPHTVIIGTDADFSAAVDPRMELFSVDTDATSVTNTTSLRDIGPAQANTTTSFSRSEADTRFLNVTGGGLEGDLNFGGNAARNFTIDPRTSRPDNPAPNRAIFRTDTEPNRIEINTSEGWRVAKLEQVYPPIDNFETGDYEPRWNGSFSGSANVTTAAAIEGTYGLELQNYVELFSAEGGGLDNYPDRGDSFRGHFRIRDNADGHQYWMGFGMPAESFNDGYTVEMTMQDSGAGTSAVFRIQVRTGGNRSTLDSATVPDFTQDGVYSIEIDYGSPIVGRLIRESDGTQLATISGTDGTHDAAGVALRCALNGAIDVDELEML